MTVEYYDDDDDDYEWNDGKDVDAADDDGGSGAGDVGDVG